MTATWSDPLAAQLLSIFSGAPFAFSELALTLFARQYERCAPYRRYCDARGKTPATVTDWREIPHLPVTAFKHARIYSGEGEPVHYFETSGTTQGAERRGRHYFERLDLYRACSRPVFRRFVLPDLPDGARMPMLMLAQSPAENPRSSLSWYLSQQAEAFAAEFDWYVDSQGCACRRWKPPCGRRRAPSPCWGPPSPSSTWWTAACASSCPPAPG